MNLNRFFFLLLHCVGFHPPREWGEMNQTILFSLFPFSVPLCLYG